MSGHRWEIEAHAGPVREALVGGGAALLVRVRLFDRDGCEQPAPDAFTDLRASAARWLAFELLAAAEHRRAPQRRGGKVGARAMSAAPRLQIAALEALVEADEATRVQPTTLGCLAVLLGAEVAKRAERRTPPALGRACGDLSRPRRRRASTENGGEDVGTARTGGRGAGDRAGAWETLPAEVQVQVACRLARLLAALVEAERDE